MHEYVLNMFSFPQVRMNRATTLRAFKVFKGKSDWQSGVVLAGQSMSEKCKRIDCQTKHVPSNSCVATFENGDFC